MIGMDEETPGAAMRRILAENLRLHQKVFELEGKLKQYSEAASRDSTRIVNIRRLLEQKDVTLEQYAAELEEKRAELQQKVLELQKRNEQLQLWMTTLRLYQELFEHARECMIVVNREGKIVLYNKTVEEIMGEKIRDCIYRPIEEAQFGSFDPGTAAMVRESLAKHMSLERSMVVRGRRITTSVFPIGSQGDPRGALIKIAVSA